MLFVEQALDERPRLRVSEFNLKKSASLCIAESHVWSDGLGNALQNNMVAFQLLRIQRLAKDLSEYW